MTSTVLLTAFLAGAAVDMKEATPTNGNSAPEDDESISSDGSANDGNGSIPTSLASTEGSSCR